MDRARIEETVVKLSIFTIVLDGEPYIEQQLPIFQQLKCDWQWIVVHGAAMNNGSTRWCQPQEPRLSQDGTTEYLHSLDFNDDRITLLENRRWESKDAMVNTALRCINEPCALMEIDSDEIWKPWQLERIVKGIEINKIDAMQFRCRYFVGSNLITQGSHCYGDMDYEWWRAWRFVPGMRFKSHEPPILDGVTDIRHRAEHGRDRYIAVKDESDDLGLVFDHHAYATEAQVAYKEKFYGYTGLLDGWRRLQEVKDFPVPLRDYFPQVKDDAMVIKT